MADRDNIQLQGLKTIRQMQEDMQQEEREKTLAAHIEETQRILEDKEEAKGVQDSLPNLAHAKTIKESMQDYMQKTANQDEAQKAAAKPQSAQSTPITQPAQPTSLPQSKPLQPQSSQPANPAKDSITTQKNTALESKFTESVEDKELSKQEKYEQILKANANTKQETWLLLEEFLKLSGLERERVAQLIQDKTIKSKQENGRIYVEASTGTSALIKKVESRLVSLDMSGNALDPVFVEKTIATILGLHDKVLSSKDETIAALKSENSFLKEALVSMQEIYDDDKKTIEVLRQQLQKTQEEVEFVKRKYKLMWGKVSNSTT